MDPFAVRRIEEIADRAWPAAETARGHDWEARSSHGMHRRLNSATVWAAADLAATVRQLEQWYRHRELPAIFKLTRGSAPGLDEYLARRGYRPEARVVIMTAPVPPARPVAGVEVAERADCEWRDAFAAISGYEAERRNLLDEVLDRIALPLAAAAIRIDGRIVATGLAVAEGDHAGLFEMATHPEHRARGLAGRVRDALLAWMAGREVTTAYLQVLVGNRPAGRLYGAAGFAPHHEYWYRVGPGGLPAGRR